MFLVMRLTLVVAAFSLGLSAHAQTNRELLQERLISPTVYNLLVERGADTPEQRIKVIQQACLTGVLAGDDCYSDRDRRRY